MNMENSPIENRKKLFFEETPIPIVEPVVADAFANKEWKNIKILENPGEKPVKLTVIPNFPFPGKAMAWPAYYKTVKEGLENDGRPKGVGELAQAIEGGIQSSPLVKLRNELVGRLDQAQGILDSNPSTSNLQLVVVDGYRTLEVQKRLFDAYHAYVVSKNPGITELESRNLARKMVSEPPSDLEVLRTSPPPHSTGGSVDVVLVFKDRINTDSDYWLEEAMVPFGARFDEMMNPIFRDERSETAFYEKKSDPTDEEKEAIKFRRILFHVLSKVGFSNYFTEFWHYDFGNQFHALATNTKEAQFGFAGGLSGGKVIEDFEAEQESFEEYARIHGREEAERVKSHFGL